MRKLILAALVLPALLLLASVQTVSAQSGGACLFDQATQRWHRHVIVPGGVQEVACDPPADTLSSESRTVVEQVTKSPQSWSLKRILSDLLNGKSPSQATPADSGLPELPKVEENQPAFEYVPPAGIPVGDCFYDNSLGGWVRPNFIPELNQYRSYPAPECAQ